MERASVRLHEAADRLAVARDQFLAAEPVDRAVVREAILASWWRSREWHVAANRLDLSYLRPPDPDSTLARVVSLIPFCSPLLMNFRTALTNVPAWEIVLSVVLMSITIGVIVWISSRIYRVGILMYGKRPNLPEIMRWLRYS